MGEEKEKKKRNPLSLVTRKGTRKVLSKWRKLENNDEPGEPAVVTRKLFGMPLDEAFCVDPSLDGVPLPVLVRQCIDFVTENGLDLEGVYRVSCPKSRLDELEREANERTLSTHFCRFMPTKTMFRDAHEAAGLLKRYIRALPHPIVPSELDVLVEKCSCDWRGACTCEVARKLSDAISTLSVYTQYLLAYVFLHAQQVVSKESDNKMGVPALGLLLQQVFDVSRRFVCLLLTNASSALHGSTKQAFYVFEHVKLRIYVPPRAPADVESWTCDDRPLIDAEMEKQNNLLNHLHAQIQRTTENTEKKALEERAWSVQQTITLLRRRRRSVVEPTKNEANAVERSKIKPLMLEEKHLLATQSRLMDEIAEERLRIAKLSFQLLLLEPDSLILCNTLNSSSTGDLQLQAEAMLEEAARAALVSEITRLRSECASFRAQLELVVSAKPEEATHAHF